MSTVNNMQIQDDEGNVFHPETSIEQIVGENGTQVFPGGKPGNMESSDMTAAFDEVKMRENIKSGEKHRVLFGKIQKFFADLKTVAFSGKYGDLSERPTLGGAAGYKVADNDTTNNSEFLTTARVAYEHGQEIDALSRDLKFPDGTGFYPDIKDGVHGYNTDSKRGADTFIPFRADEVAMFEITIPNTTEDNILVTVTDKLGFKDAPNVIFVSAANHLTIDAIYNPYKTITTDAKTMVKLCAYAPTQKIEYREVAEVFPTITKDSIAIKAKAFVSGVGDKVAHVVIARFV